MVYFKIDFRWHFLCGRQNATYSKIKKIQSLFYSSTMLTAIILYINAGYIHSYHLFLIRGKCTKRAGYANPFSVQNLFRCSRIQRYITYACV